MSMQHSTVMLASYDTHPQSNKRRLRITVNQPFASGGDRGNATDLWVDPKAPIPPVGELIAWGAWHVGYMGERWNKLEYDSPWLKPLQ